MKSNSNHINEILEIPDFDVIEIEKTEKILIIKGRSPEKAQCPHCRKIVTNGHSGKIKRVRHLDILGKASYLEFKHMSYHCEHCRLYFQQQMSFLTNTKHYTDAFLKELAALLRGCSIKHASQKLREPYSNLERLYYTYLESADEKNDSFSAKRIGIDEIALKKGRGNFVLLIYDLDQGIVLDILIDRKQKTLEEYLRNLPSQCKLSIKVVCIDMWRPYRECIRKLLPECKIVIDRFHVAKELNKAIDKIRKKLHHEGKFSRLTAEERKSLFWAVRFSSQSLKKRPKYRKVLKKAMRICRVLRLAIKLRDQFKSIFNLKQAFAAQPRLSRWLQSVNRSKLTPLKDFVSLFRRWKSWIMNFFPFRFTNAPSEGLNNKIKLIKRLGFGFESFEHFRLRILHTCGALI